MKKILFDILPLLIFFITYKMKDIYAATLSIMIVSFFQILYLRRKYKKIELTSLINFFLIFFFGSATIFLKNDSLIKWKPTILYWSFFSVILIMDFFKKRNIVKYLLEKNLFLSEKKWKIFNMSWAVFFFFLGFINIFIAFSGYFTELQWVSFKVFGSLVLFLVFILIQLIWLKK